MHFLSSCLSPPGSGRRAILLFQGQAVGVVLTVSYCFRGQQAVGVVLTVSYCFSSRQADSV